MTESPKAAKPIGLSNRAQMELVRAVTERGAPIRTRVSGRSMWPFVRDGDVLTIAPLEGRSPAVGQILAFAQPGSGRLAIHRVVARADGGWLIRGDNSPEPDGIVPREDLLGVVTRIERGGHDVRLGLGAERNLIAALNRGGGLSALKALLVLPRRGAALVLGRTQALPLYRALGTRFAPRVVIRETPMADRDVTEWVATRGKKTVGFVQYVCHPPERAPWAGHWLFSLRVSAWYRGLGIGRTLTQRVIGHAVTVGAPELLLVVFDDNARATALYRSLGFERTTVSGLEAVFADEERRFGRRRVVMRKRLGSDET